MQASIDTEVVSDSKTPARRKTTIQSLDRGLVMLESVAKSGHAVSLPELADLFGIDRSSAFRLADTLKRRGFLSSPGGSKGYILGPSMWRLAQTYDWSQSLVKVARPYLQWLASQTRETAHLAIREGDEALFIDNALGNQLITVSGQVGDRVPLYCTAHGRALLADYDAPQLLRLLGARPMKSYTPHTITSVERLAESCAELRAQGYVADDREYQDALRCVAAPIRDRDGAVIGSIGISAPLVRMPEQQCSIRAEQVMRAAQQVHAALSTPSRRVSTAGNWHSRVR
jgi:IclR family transcriptional regulator, acetate operon repressor